MRRRIILLTALICSSLFVQSQTYKVGILFDQFASARWQIDDQLLTNKFKSLGVQSETLVAHSEPGLQLTQAKQFIADGVDALIIIARDAQEASEITDLAKQKGIKVIAYDRFIPNSKVDLYASYDNMEVGRMQARAAIAAVPSGNYLLLNGPESDKNSIQFHKGQMEVINGYNTKNQISIVHDIVLESWNELQTTMTLYDTDVDISTIDCIIAAADIIASGAGQFVDDESEMKRIFLTGQDAAPESIQSIKDGFQSMTILKPLKPLAEATAQMTYQMIRGKKVKDVSNLTFDGVTVKGKLFKPIMIDQSNVDTNEALKEQIRLIESIKTKK